MGPEKKIENQIKTELERRRAWYVKIAASNYMPVGIPDILACYNGRFIAIEVKRPGRLNGTSPAQRLQLDNIVRAGGYGLVTDNVDAVITLLDKISKLDIEPVGGEYGHTTIRQQRP